MEFFSYTSINTFIFHVNKHTEGRIFNMDDCIAWINFVSKEEAGNYTLIPVPSNLKFYEIDCWSRMFAPICNDNT